MSSATVTSKGQVTIPADIRAAFAIQPGDKLIFFRSLNGELRVHVSHPQVGAGRASIPAGGVDFSRDAIGESVADGVGERSRKTPPADRAA